MSKQDRQTSGQALPRSESYKPHAHTWTNSATIGANWPSRQHALLQSDKWMGNRTTPSADEQGTTLQWQQMTTSLQMGNPLALECSEVQRTHPTDHKGLRPTRPSNEQWRQDNAHTDTLQTQNCSSDYSASDKMRSATRARRIESALAGDNSGLSTRDSKLAMTDAIPTS